MYVGKGYVSNRLFKLSVMVVQIDTKHKCESCVQAKLTRLSFQRIKKNIEPLDLINSDIYVFKSIQSRGGNKYFITFINDYSIFCYMYLLKSKDEAIEIFMQG